VTGLCAKRKKGGSRHKKSNIRSHKLSVKKRDEKKTARKAGFPGVESRPKVLSQHAPSLSTMLE